MMKYDQSSCGQCNRSDNHVLTGRPFIMRLFTGLFKPKLAVTGTDFTGEIEAIGNNVRSFKIADKIMGFGGAFGCGSHAQYLLLPELKATRAMLTMPDNLNYEQAAACLEGAVYAAIQVLGSKPQAGQKAMVYGASGAIGFTYVNSSNHYGVSVTADIQNGTGCFDAITRCRKNH